MTPETATAAFGLPEPGHKIPARDYGPFDRYAIARYAIASGDDNPLHLDPHIARAAGLADTPVHGMLMLSCFETYLKQWRPDLFIARLSCKFLRPVLAGESIGVTGRVVSIRDAPRKARVLRLMARAPNDDLAILAEATVLCKAADASS